MFNVVMKIKFVLYVIEEYYMESVLGYSFVVEYLFSICKFLSLIFSSERKRGGGERWR